MKPQERGLRPGGDGRHVHTFEPQKENRIDSEPNRTDRDAERIWPVDSPAREKIQLGKRRHQPPLERKSESIAVGISHRGPMQSGHPYAPSWFNRLLTLCGNLSIPPWAVYGGWLVAQGLLANIAAWNMGLLPVGSFNRLLVFCGIWSFEVLLFSHYLDVLARDALAGYSPMLKNMSNEEFERIQYEFTTMPRRPVLWISVVGFAIGIFLAYSAKPYQPLMFAWPWLAYVFYGVSLALFCVFSYRVIRQLRFASNLYASTEKVDLYYLRPIYSLSRLAVWTSLSVLVIINLNVLLLTPQLLESSAFLSVLGLAMVLSLATFLMPLFGIKSRILAEKNGLMAATGREIENAYDQLEKAINTGDSKKLADVRVILDLVHRKKDFVHSIPVWPWKPGTFTALLSAIIIPIVLGILSRIMQKVLLGV
jgi:hypothetical protein